MTPIQQFMMNAFVRVRFGVGIIGLIFPFVLWGGGRLYYKIHLALTMSAYYHTTVECRDPHTVAECPAEVTHPDPEHPTLTKIVDPPPGIGPMRNWFVWWPFHNGSVFVPHSWIQHLGKDIARRRGSAGVDGCAQPDAVEDS